jgi:hypothetical protein
MSAHFDPLLTKSFTPEVRYIAWDAMNVGLAG